MLTFKRKFSFVSALRKDRLRRQVKKLIAVQKVYEIYK